MACHQGCAHESACLTSVPVFEGLNVVDRQLLQKVTRSRHFSKGEFIFQEGERSETLFVVNEGLIKLTKISAEGKEQIVRLLFPGDFFGLSSLLKKDKHYVNAETSQNTVICYIEKKDFLTTMEKDAELAYRFLLEVNERLCDADESVGSLSLMEVDQRLARALILFHKKMSPNKGSFILPITKKELASYIGTTPESVSRKLLSFKTQKLIQMDGSKQIQILELDQLKLMAEMA
ncbi:Crp/Fnr family transcriptional regulator [Neobacillus pocheonensis]|uniref:Crp/Fnr family transcriptional regulator n=1 Tax=Neobacillus pocheonensis TaxID=363869 RepID=UPI003D270A99